MEINLDMDNFANKKIDGIKFQKMILVFNALENGWTVKKKDEAFIFTKNHEGKKEVLLDTYLQKFFKINLDISKMIA
jgi:hypothetical protein